MPLMDLSIALNDSMLRDTFQVIRRQAIGGQNGLGSASNTTPGPTQRGIVYPSNANELKRMRDMSVQVKTITVITNTSLQGQAEAAGTDYLPDIVVWNGDNFLVQAVDDYSNFAAGFVLAICTSTDLVDAPPQG